MMLSTAFRNRNEPFRRLLFITGDNIKIQQEVLHLMSPVTQEDFNLFYKLVLNSKVTVVYGSRQTGKTWLLQHIISSEAKNYYPFKVAYNYMNIQQKKITRYGITKLLDRFVMNNTKDAIRLQSNFVIRFFNSETSLAGQHNYDYVLVDDFSGYNYYSNKSKLVECILTLNENGRIVICTGDAYSYASILEVLDEFNINTQEVILHGSQDGRNL